MKYKQNEQLRLAAEFVSSTGHNLFLTGQAGTGKTTFLRSLPEITSKRMVVVAPTGVAAINAGGVTIHSFFQLHFGVQIPGAIGQDSGDSEAGMRYRMNREKIRILKCLDLLVIDEISMVRADVLDAVDEVLRKYRFSRAPFGGVQLLMIGDLHQLSPVVKEQEWDILRQYYPSAYFFDSRALSRSEMLILELKEHFRQKDEDFLRLLNRVRTGDTRDDLFETLNSRYNPDFLPDDSEGYITLTTHNATASGINNTKLEGIRQPVRIYRARTEGEFSPQDYPTDASLTLKKDAQVMFIKNDPSGERRFYNGKIGRITRLEQEAVYVRSSPDEEEIRAEYLKWENVRYEINRETRDIRSEIVGTFEQIPLKLAWAITIHKSQGLTFDKVIIDAAAAFAFGQVYVALSRCRTLDGIVLRSRISATGVKTDSLVQQFALNARQQEPGVEKLREAQHAFRQKLLLEMFDFSGIRNRIGYLLKLLRSNTEMATASSVSHLARGIDLFDNEVEHVGGRFRIQLQQMMKASELTAEYEAVQERIRKAVVYFQVRLDSFPDEYLRQTELITDNKVLLKQWKEASEKVQRELFILRKCMKAAYDGFDPLDYIRIRADADLDFRPDNIEGREPGREQPEQGKTAGLERQLKSWREALSEQKGIPVYMILPGKSMKELMKTLPVTMEQLSRTIGFGPVRVNKYGKEVISIVRKWCIDNNIPKQGI